MKMNSNLLWGAFIGFLLLMFYQRMKARKGGA